MPITLAPAQTKVARRERFLLLIAAAFLLAGTLTLAAHDSPFSILHSALAILSFIISFAVAHFFLSRYLPHRDPFLLPMAALLTGWGLLLIGRLAINFLLRQAAWLLISTAALLAVVWLSHNLRWLRRFRYTWLFGGLALLAATLLFGVNPSGYGPRLWLGAWGIYFQPSEPLKLLLVVYLASYLAEKRELLVSERWKVGRWRLPPLAYVGPLLAMLGLATILLAWQQDLGAAILFFFTFLAMLYLATGQWEYIATGLVLFLLVGLAGYRISGRVALRIDGWLNPWPEAADRAFQIVQSLLAFGTGGVFGQGLGLGHPGYIPAVHTDFVFAAIGEEFGLAGTLVIVALYGVLALRGFRIAARASRPFERFLAAGLTAGLVIQAWVIMAGNVKLAPIAGVTLPFVSYGGSSLLTCFITLALLLRISSPTSNVPSPKSKVRYPTSPVPLSPCPLVLPYPLLHLACALSLALALLAATCGYWGIVRASYLRGRDDDPRRVLYEQHIVRGRILDRDGAVLANVDVAGDGTVTRHYPIPEAAPAVGYASLRYGTGGIEAALDAELRGEANRSDWQATWDELLHRPPHGLDVQLTLDAALQVESQEALAGQAGGVVLLDAATGEILALASSPTFDPARLDEEWERLSEDLSAPLVNRATQGLYQPGAALQTIVLAEALNERLDSLSTPITNATATLSVNGARLGCSTALSEPYTLADAYAAACPAPFADLGERLGATGLVEMVDHWTLTTPPSLEIPTEAADWNAKVLSTTAAVRAEAIGQGRLTVSPLQMALVAGALANEGQMPAPRLVLRVQDMEGGWREHSSAALSSTVISPAIAKSMLGAWPAYGSTTSTAGSSDVMGHYGVAIAGQKQEPHVWFLGVAPAKAPRYAIAVLIERAADPQQAVIVGTALLRAASR
ncbi:MAG: FtsW/RodA/SpoVE family cell cycle protein [Chloroflexota bacterium]|nr:FtsW/RodA/SpoVE family cell cycle protein [Chloroflexota bacterium]